MEVIFFLFLIIIIVLFGSIPIVIGAVAYSSRKKKRNQIRSTVPAHASYVVPVRLNSKKANDKVIKLKSFEYSGFLYVADNTVGITGTGGQRAEFQLATCIIDWPGVQMQNGLMEWLSIGNNHQEKIYVNAESGIFVFRTSSKLPTTRGIYGHLKSLQQAALTPPPVPA